jgi:hypothetical protein
MRESYLIYRFNDTSFFLQKYTYVILGIPLKSVDTERILNKFTGPKMVHFVPNSNPAEFVGFESPIATYPNLVIY